MIIEARAVGQRGAALPPHDLDVVDVGWLQLGALLEQVVRAEYRGNPDRLLQVLSPLGLSSCDVEAAVATALQAFVDGVYFVIVDGLQVHRLDDVVTVGPRTRLRFLRPLAQAAG